MARPNKLHTHYRRDTGKIAWSDAHELNESTDLEEDVLNLDYVTWLEQTLLKLLEG